MEPAEGISVAAVRSEAASATPLRNIVFAAPADDPRARRPADVGSLILGSLTVLLAAWAYSESVTVDRRLFAFFEPGLPSWISSVLTIVYISGGLYAVGLLVAILFFGGGRSAIARDMLTAAVMATAATIALSLLAGPEWPDVLPELHERGGFPSYPVTRLALAVAVLRVASPYLALPMRRLGNRLILTMTLAALALNYGTPTALIGALALGVAVAAAVHLIFGSGVGIPSRARVIDGLAAIGVVVDDVHYLPGHGRGRTYLRAELDTGELVQVKVYGRDAVDAAIAARLWRRMWYRDSDRAVTVTGLQQVEHEALVLLLAREGGVSTPEVVALGRGPADDAFLVTRWVEGTPLADRAADQVGDDVLAACWDAQQRLIATGIAHRSIDGRRIQVTDDAVVLRDLATAEISPAASTASADAAQMLAATAAVVGSERAIDAARAALGDDGLRACLPLVQGSSMSKQLQDDLDAAGIAVKDLRGEAARAIDAPSPELVRLARVSWANVAMVALTLFAVYALLSALADIGFDTIVDEVSEAEWSWVVLAFLLAQLTNVGEYVSLTGVVRNEVPFGPTIMFRYALSFISLAVPSDAGAIAMNIRYMQRLGESTAAAVAQGPLLTVFSKGFDLILLVIAGQFVTRTIDLDELDAGPILRMLLAVVVLITLGVLVAFAVERFRRRLVPPLVEAWHAVKASITNPERLLRVAGGTLMQKVLFAMTLSASVAAYGSSLTFAEALFVNTVISLFVGLIPVPGGVGVAEAALTAGLSAVGVPEEQAIAAAITHRMVTAYIPPVFGWYASRWLVDRDYL